MIVEECFNVVEIKYASDGLMALMAATLNNLSVLSRINVDSFLIKLVYHAMTRGGEEQNGNGSAKLSGRSACIASYVAMVMAQWRALDRTKSSAVLCRQVKLSKLCFDSSYNCARPISLLVAV